MIHWTKTYFLVAFALLCACFQAHGQEINFVEQFALAEDRSQVLNQLVPGTEDYYYYHCLYCQSQGEYDKVDELLKAWQDRFNGRSRRYKVVQNRQALLRFDSDPSGTYKYLTRRLDLRFDHRRQIPTTERSLPSVLDANNISVGAFTKNAMKRYGRRQVFTDTGLEYIEAEDLDYGLAHLLKRIKYPDYPNLVNLIVREFKLHERVEFGSFAIHQNLTVGQMDELLKQMPKLIDDSNFVNSYLAKLLPSDDVNRDVDWVIQREHLDRLKAFTDRLNPSFNSLKACVLYQLLELNRKEGLYDRDLFLEYLKYPRQIGYVRPELLKRVQSRSHIVNLNADYHRQTMLMPIRSDEELVRDYLHQLLVDAQNFAPYRPYIRAEYLGRVFATVKILNGKGNIERWSSVLSPSQYKALLSRVDLDFPLTNKEFFAAEDKVSIEIFTKNISKLIVKTYEINAFNYYRKFGREIDTNINLDGLVPNTEKTINYDDEPAVRVRRQFEFEELDDNGVYIVDFIGGGKSSRALIRRGRVFMIGRNTVAGHMFKAYDDNNKHLDEASVWIAGNQYQSNEDGQMVVPYTNQPGIQKAIVSVDGICALQTFSHDAEQYRLRAGIYVDRESLLFNQKTKVLIRPGLRVAGVPASVGVLEDVRLIVRSVDQSGNQATKTFDSLVLKDDEETVCEFVVPPRLSSISFELSAKVENISKNQKEKLAVSRSYRVNKIDTTDVIQDVHLMPTDAGYIAEVRGKTGESRSGQGVSFKLYRRGFKDSVRIDLQSNEDGQMLLGNLDGITKVEAYGFGGSQRKWSLNKTQVSPAKRVVSVEGDPVQIAAPTYLNEISRGSISLLEKRNGQFVSDQFEKLKLVDRLVIADGLAAGEYVLRFKRTGETTSVSVFGGETDTGVVLGKYRRAELRDRSPLVIDSVTTNEKDVVVNLANVNDRTRVHVMATRYEPRFDSYSEFARVGDIQPWSQSIAVRRNAYMAGRRLSDEYQYILNRRYENKFAGNMLDRPSVLIRPWAVRDTQNNVESLARGNDFRSAGTDDEEPQSRSQAKKESMSGYEDFANLDFLENSSVLLQNLKPDSDGKVVIAAKDLAGLNHVRIIALDSVSAFQTTVSLKESEFQLRDLRLQAGLDPNNHLAQSKEIDVLRKGDTLTIEDLASGRFQLFDDLSDVFHLYLSLNPNTELRNFEFLLGWSGLADEKKRELYSKYSCHELNYYLFKKDQAFFDSVVLPHVGFKSEQGFVDRFLLDRELQNYVDSQWDFSRLNVFERILLSQRMEANSQDIVRSLEDRYWLSPPKREQLDMLYGKSIVSGYLANASRDGKVSLGKDLLPGLATFEAKDEVRDSLAVVAGSRARGRFSNRAGGGLGGGGGRGGLSFGSPAQEADAKSLKLGELSKADSSKARSQAMRRLAEAGRTIRGVDANAEEEIQLGLQLAREKYKNVDFDEDGVDAYYFSNSDRFLQLRENEKLSLYRRLPATKEWIEQQYYRLQLNQQTPNLVGTNRFWKDYAEHDGGTFLSPYFAEASRTFTEMMFALAVLDLPEKAQEHQTQYVDNAMMLKAAGPMVVMNQQFRKVEFKPRNTAILISENYFQKNDRYREEDGVRYDKFVNEKFYVHTLYGAQVVVTNPTSTPQAIDLLVQIPSGSVAVSGSQDTRSMQLNLGAFSTQTFEYFFYFPTAGQFSHYPAHVSSKDEVLAVAEGQPFKVVDQIAGIDKTSWVYVSQNGTDEEVLDFLQTRNLLKVDLKKIAFRMRDDSFFKRVINSLKNRYIYNHTLWSYSLQHFDTDASREFLKQDKRISDEVGRYFESELLSVKPYDRNWYQHREYTPLVNARIHKVGGSNKILNPIFHAQYHLLMNVLACKKDLSSDDHLVVTYYLLLQDRIAEAIEHFGRIDTGDLNEKIQFDYCDAYINFYLENPGQAEVIANRWKDYPVDLWRNRFRNVLAQVAEIRGGRIRVTDKRANDQRQTKLASEAGSFEFEIVDRAIKLNSQAISEAVVNFYEMDIELMFSRSPFAEKDLERFSVIKPTESLDVAIVGKQTTIKMPESFANKNVLVEVRAGDQVKSEAYLANSLSVQTIEKYGQMQVSNARTGKPISRAYVKVYSLNGGQAKFHKDGYTDLRGRFDYVSQSNNPIDGVSKYSILVMSAEHGATTRQVSPPAE